MIGLITPIKITSCYLDTEEKDSKDISKSNEFFQNFTLNSS